MVSSGNQEGLRMILSVSEYLLKVKEQWPQMIADNPKFVYREDQMKISYSASRK